MSAALMRIPSKRPAIIISTIQFAWHNNNFIMQDMYLKKTAKLKSCTQIQAQLNFRATIYSLNYLYLGKIFSHKRGFGE